MPALAPVTIPVLPTVAIDGLLLLHVPPAGEDDRAVVVPAQIPAEPLIIDGELLTVSTDTVLQPEPSVYVTLVVPMVTPVAIPVLEPIVAIVEEVVLHVPPVTLLPNAVVKPAHTESEPVIEGSVDVTVTTVVAAQPELTL